MARKRKRSRSRSRGQSPDPDAQRLAGPSVQAVSRAHRRADQRISTIGDLPPYRERMARKDAGLEPKGVQLQYVEDAKARAVDQRPLPAQPQKKRPEKVTLKKTACHPRPKNGRGDGSGRKFAGRYCK